MSKWTPGCILSSSCFLSWLSYIWLLPPDLGCSEAQQAVQPDRARKRALRVNGDVSHDESQNYYVSCGRSCGHRRYAIARPVREWRTDDRLSSIDAARTPGLHGCPSSTSGDGSCWSLLRVEAFAILRTSGDPGTHGHLAHRCHCSFRICVCGGLGVRVQVSGPWIHTALPSA